MFCKEGHCPEFRAKEPELAQRLQNAGIIAHFGDWGMRCEFYCPPTPVSRHNLMADLAYAEAKIASGEWEKL